METLWGRAEGSGGPTGRQGPPGDGEVDPIDLGHDVRGGHVMRWEGLIQLNQPLHAIVERPLFWGELGGRMTGDVTGAGGGLEGNSCLARGNKIEFATSDKDEVNGVLYMHVYIYTHIYIYIYIFILNSLRSYRAASMSDAKRHKEENGGRGGLDLYRIL